MNAKDWPVGATFTYNSPYGKTNWIGIVKKFSTNDNGEIDGVTSTNKAHYSKNSINLETKAEFTGRVREQKLGTLDID